MKFYSIKGMVLVLALGLMATGCTKKKSAKRTSSNPPVSSTPDNGIRNNNVEPGQNPHASPAGQTPVIAGGPSVQAGPDASGEGREPYIHMAPMPNGPSPSDEDGPHEPDYDTGWTASEHDNPPLSQSPPLSQPPPPLPLPNTPATVPASEPGQCSAAQNAMDRDWFPGLPYAPLQEPIRTGGASQGGKTYTDGRRDDLMAHAIRLFDEVESHEAVWDIYGVTPSRYLSIRIANFEMQASPGESRTIRINFSYKYSPDNPSLAVQLEGEFPLQPPFNNPERPIELKANGLHSNRYFTASVRCMDVTSDSCENALIRIDSYSTADQLANSRVSAFVVHRSGPANLAITARDGLHPDTIRNAQHRRFAQFLSNTANNSCLSLIAGHSSGRRRISQCDFDYLTEQCGASEIRRPYASTIKLRTWAVAYGQAGFEMGMTHSATNQIFVVNGPLVHKDKPPYAAGADLVVEGLAGPMLPLPHRDDALKDEWMESGWIDESNGNGFVRGIDAAYLVSNDGGGNLNLQFNFKGRPDSATRLNITMLSKDTIPCD